LYSRCRTGLRKPLKMRRRRIRNWEHKLKENGYKITIPRKTILSTLEQQGGHPNAREVFYNLSAEFPEIGLTTIYRTLELFVKLGILKRYDFGDRQSRYEIISETADHHHHIVCENCRKVIEYRDFLKEETILIEKIQKKLEKKINFKIKRHELEFYGCCKNCTKKDQQEDQSSIKKKLV